VCSKLFALALVLSALTLATGLALVVAGQDRPRLRLAVDGFVLGVLPTLLVVHVLPHLCDQLGVMALTGVAMGYGAFWLAERVAERQALGARVVVTVLALHSLLDGASLGMARGLGVGRASGVFMAALVVHRLPEGLVLGALLVPRYGPKVATGAAAMLAVLTLAGAAAGSELLHHADQWSLNLAVALGMGALMRAALHGHASPRMRAMPGVLGAVVGAALALSVPALP
jgi:hypothetical protein